MIATIERLTERTRALVDIPSVSRNEQVLLDYIKTQLPPSLVTLHDHDTVLVVTQPRRPGYPLVLLAGHTDTVPIAANVPSQLNGDMIWGRGTADMKGGLAVMIELAHWLEESRRLDSKNPLRASHFPYDFAFGFFGREELPATENPLPPALRANAALREMALAVLMEPTSNVIEVGCQGNLNLEITIQGNAVHTSRPWLGVNAAHEMIKTLHGLVNAEPNDVTIGGLTFREVASITSIRAGSLMPRTASDQDDDGDDIEHGVRNVSPNIATVSVNVRFAPNRDPQEVATSWTERFSSDRAKVTVVSLAHPAAVVTDHPIAQALLAAAGREAFHPMSAWTNTADFTTCGVPAVNFGPGDMDFAHKDDEQIAIRSLGESFETLQRFARGDQQ